MNTSDKLYLTFINNECTGVYDRAAHSYSISDLKASMEFEDLHVEKYVECKYGPFCSAWQEGRDCGSNHWYGTFEKPASCKHGSHCSWLKSGNCNFLHDGAVVWDANTDVFELTINGTPWGHIDGAGNAVTDVDSKRHLRVHTKTCKDGLACAAWRKAACENHHAFPRAAPPVCKFHSIWGGSTLFTPLTSAKI